MKTSKIGLILLLFSFCTITAKSQDTGTLIFDYIDSECIKNNIFGDTAKQKVIVYLPPSYYKTDMDYPVLYYLTGSFTEVDWMINGTFQGLKMNESLDSLILHSVIREMIVVIVTAKVNLTENIRMPTFYKNSPVNGNWEDFIIKELIPHVDNKYRTINEPIARGITGHSMGGYGTLRFSLLYPDKFGYAYSLAFGMTDNPLVWGHNDDIILSEKEYYRWKGQYKLLQVSKGASLEQGLELFRKTAEDKKMVWPLAMGTSLAPIMDLTPPFYYIPLRADKDSILFDTLIFNEFRDYPDLYFNTMLKGYNECKNKKLVRLVLEVGLYDMPMFIDGCNHISSQLIKNKIPHEVLYTNFAHSNQLRYRIENYMLPYFSRHLGLYRGQKLYNP